MLFFKLFNKQFFQYFIVLFLISSFSNTLYCKNSVDIFFKLDSSILFIEKQLIKYYSDSVSLIHEVLHSHKSPIQYQYLLKEKILKDFYYNDDNFKCILQQASSEKNYTSIQIRLNKIMQFIIGPNKNLNKKFIFNPLKKETKIKFHAPIQYLKKEIYQYLSLAIPKYILQINLSFYEKKLFNSVYYIHLSSKSKDFLEKHLKNKYPSYLKKDEHSSKKTLQFQDKSKNINISFYPIEEKNNIYVLKYTLIEKDNLYKQYLKSIKNKMNSFILKNKFLNLHNY